MRSEEINTRGASRGEGRATVCMCIYSGVKTSALGTSEFDAQMSGIKFWKGDENLRPIYKKTFYDILSGCLHFSS